MVELAVAAISLVGPYLAKGAEEFAKEVGKEAFEGVRSLAKKLRAWWEGDPVAKATADNLTQNPTRYSTILSDLLVEKLDNDPEFAADLQKLVDAVQPATTKIIQRMDVGKGVTGADVEAIVGGHLAITQEIKHAENVVGLKAKQIGGPSAG
jgi:hypothetical protein